MIIRASHVVPEGVRDVRLSNYARVAFSDYLSRKGVSKALKRGEFRVNGVIAQSGDWVVSGQLIELLDLQQRVPKPYALPLDIVFEDECLAVINKPAGIEVSGNKFRTIENALVGQVTKSAHPDALPWPRPAHRLDYATSGLLLVAKLHWLKNIWDKLLKIVRSIKSTRLSCKAGYQVQARSPSPFKTFRLIAITNTSIAFSLCETGI